MYPYQHRYPLKCPSCEKDLTADEAVMVHFVVAGYEHDLYSRLDEKGTVQDKDDVIMNGYHSDTNCRNCGESLAEHEILQEKRAKG